jgi:ribosome-associated toxin RatA of RatAB toxin-antitoxin module
MKRVYAFLLSALLFSSAQASDTVSIHTRDSDNHVIIDAVISVSVTKATAYEVMTDFDHMSAFLPNLAESRVIAKSADTMTVHQRGSIPFLFFSFDFDSTKTVKVNGRSEIVSNSLGGDSTSVSRIIDDHGTVRIEYHAEWIPSSRIAGMFGNDTAKKLASEQFAALKNEMLRRAASNRVNIAQQK